MHNLIILEAHLIKHIYVNMHIILHLTFFFHSTCYLHIPYLHQKFGFTKSYNPTTITYFITYYLIDSS